jgi:hypothetical protein
MSDDPEHVVRVALYEPVRPDVAVGGDVSVRVRVACAAGCDLGGMPLVVIAPDGSTTTHALTASDGTGNESGEITLRAPADIGQHRWQIATPSHEAGDVVHAAATLDVAIATRPHRTSLAVWAIPDAAVAGEAFTIQAGVKCADGCALRGQRIDILDAGGAVVVSARAGDTPWPGTSALHWTELTLPAPHDEGLLTLSASIEAAECELAHEAASSSFTVAIVKSPEHTLTIKVIAQDTAAPIADADIRLGAYRTTTGPSGLAEVRIGGGTYELHVWKAGYEAPTTAIDIRADMVVQIEALAVPEEDPDARWKM